MSQPNEAIIPLCLHQSIVETFEIQIGGKANVDSVTTDATPKDTDQKIDCISTLGIKSENFTGSLALGFPAATFLKVIEKMLGEKHESINDNNADACGEILNIIYAGARVKINQGGFDFNPAIPTTVRGKELSIALGSQSKVLKLVCSSDFGPFFVALYLKKNKA